jgi:hypothetical protein
MKRLTFVASALLLLSLPAMADSWHTPTIDGTIGSGEYGNTQNGTNQLATITGQTWYMTWDANNLYVGITNANLSEGAIIYIDANPLAPPNSGTNANGNLTGFNYDNTDFLSLPFRTNFVTYFKDGYREYRNSDGAGGWTSSTSYYGVYASSSNTREVAIPWSAITGSGLPSSFDFFGYLTSGGGYVYGQVPNDNPGAFIGTSATYTQYFEVSETGNGTSSSPFASEEPQPNSPVPEPCTFLQVGTGLLGLAGVARRKLGK